MADIINIPEAYRPKIEDLPGDLPRIAEVIDASMPGQGVHYALLLAQIFPGIWLSFRKIKDADACMDADDLPKKLRWIAKNINQQLPGDGVWLTLLLARGLGGGPPVYMYKVSEILRAIRDDAMRAEYDQGGVTQKDIALRYGLSQRTVEAVMARPSSPAAGKQQNLF